MWHHRPRRGRDSRDDPLAGLGNLEYRGYDSAGIAVGNDAGIETRKRAGTIVDLTEAVDRQTRNLAKSVTVE